MKRSDCNVQDDRLQSGPVVHSIWDFGGHTILAVVASSLVLASDLHLSAQCGEWVVRSGTTWYWPILIHLGLSIPNAQGYALYHTA